MKIAEKLISVLEADAHTAKRNHLHDEYDRLKAQMKAAREKKDNAAVERLKKRMDAIDKELDDMSEPA